MIRHEDVYIIGRAGKAHGSKGEVTLQLDDDVLDRTEADYLILELDGILVPFYIEEYRFKTDTTALIKFEGVDTQERARQLTGTEVYFPRADAENVDDDVLSYAQLVGYMLVNAESLQPVGRIAFVDEQTINIMFELTDGRLIPANEELIVGIDSEKREIIMNIPEGILDL